MAHIHHIARRSEWEAAVATGEYRRSTRDRSLDEEGFIHCSTAAQVPGTLALVFADEPAPLVLLTIDTERVDAEVRYENLLGGDELFPHLYGPLPVGAVVRVEPIAP